MIISSFEFCYLCIYAALAYPAEKRFVIIFRRSV